MKNLISVLTFTFFVCILNAQNQINYIAENFELDGLLDEPFWQNQNVFGNFKMKFPVDTGLAKYPTEVKIAYNDKYLLISAKCFINSKNDIILQSLKRDYSFPITDAFAIFIDPFNDKTNGYSFSVNPFGSQREGALTNGGRFGVSTSWDQAWFSETKIYDNYWIAEMAIPFKSFKYDENIKSWGINFARNYLKANETSVLSAVPLQNNVANMAFNQQFYWDKPLKKIGNNVTLIPYQSFGNSENFSNNPTTIEDLAKVGIDAKIGVSAGLNLDITVNPDFSQVEVDRQVTNLTRFSVFFPEKRNFFLENADLFSGLGFRNINPLFTRKIGLENGQIVPINYGFRLSGKVNETIRVGAMNLQTDQTPTLNKTNYNVLIVQKKVLDRSNFSVFSINKNIADKETTKEDFNNVLGANFTYRSKDGKLNSSTIANWSRTEEKLEDNLAFGTQNNYSNQNLDFDLNFERVQNNFVAETGFVPRINNYDALLKQNFVEGYYHTFANIQTWFYAKQSKILRHGIGAKQTNYWYNNRSFSENISQLYYTIQFKSGASLQPSYTFVKTNLKYNTDVFRIANDSTYLKGVYNYNYANVNFTSDKRKKYFINLSADAGTFYSGKKYGFNTELTFRANKKLSFEIYYQKDLIKYPALNEEKTFNFDLFGLNNIISFTPTIYWSNYIQYNKQADLININSRFQWRFKPMSDVFLVYTDNYDSLLNVKNRAVVLKAVFWLSI